MSLPQPFERRAQHPRRHDPPLSCTLSSFATVAILITVAWTASKACFRISCAGPEQGGSSRRQYTTGVSIRGTVATMPDGRLPLGRVEGVREKTGMEEFRIKVNGQSHSVDVLPDTPVLWVLRDNLGLTGTKFGCGIAQCGACTVFLDGQPLRSCSLPVSGLGNGEITTIEGLAGREGEADRDAWIARGVSAVRLLPVGKDHERGCSAQANQKANGPRHRSRDERQSLPVRDLCPHPRRHSRGGKVAGELSSWAMTDPRATRRSKRLPVSVRSSPRRPYWRWSSRPRRRSALQAQRANCVRPRALPGSQTGARARSLCSKRLAKCCAIP